MHMMNLEDFCYDTSSTDESFVDAIDYHKEETPDSTMEDVEPEDFAPMTAKNAVSDPEFIDTRSYQLEMFEESKQHNAIVVMDTGSGKTQVAVLRIKYELENSKADKLVWFLAPTVALCTQQFSVLTSQIPGVEMKLLCGNDDVASWSEVGIWNAYLKNVRVMVTTYQVLADALTHAFVTMQRLSLIVFDEAHNCTRRHPGCHIMKFYHDRKQNGNSVPAILGLTASPVHSSLGDLERIEATLDGKCSTPTKHRGDLMAFANRPTLLCERYGPDIAPDPPSYTRIMEKIWKIWQGMLGNIDQDPFILQMKAENTERSRVQMEKTLEKKNTYSIQQMKSLFRTSSEMRAQLGPWATSYYIHASIQQYLESVTKDDHWFATWEPTEKAYMASALREAEIQPPQECDLQLSSKLEALIRVLSTNYQDNTLGVVFVKEKVTVSLVKHVLSIHPLTRERFRVGAAVGTSNFPGKRRNLGDLIQPHDDTHLNLNGFRSGNLNLLIATSVLEEGIDVPACNLIVCFDLPTNLKSFIQRRGRARMMQSSFVVLASDNDESKHSTFEELEEKMREKYQDEMRESQEMEKREKAEEGKIPPPFCVAKTGAYLEFHQAKSHLHHFCDAVFAKQYVNSSPYYCLKKTVISKSRPPLFQATVVLPSSLTSNLRRIQSPQAWDSEGNATKDAAFEAYKLLYDHGLVNDHLMPLKVSELLIEVETRSSTLGIGLQWDPWLGVVSAWRDSKTVYQRSLVVRDSAGELQSQFEMVLPVPIPEIPAFELFWGKMPWTLTFGPQVEMPAMADAVALAHKHSSALLFIAHGYRIPLREDGQYIIGFRSCGEGLSMDQRGGRRFSMESITEMGDSMQLPYLLRDPSGKVPYYFDTWLPQCPPLELLKRPRPVQESDCAPVPWVAVKKYRWRHDLFRPIHDVPAQKSKDKLPGTKAKLYDYVWPAHKCFVDTTPFQNVQFGSLIPYIEHILELYLAASTLNQGIIQPLAIQDVSLVLTAMTPLGTRELVNYERLEFLGDSILKILASVNVAREHPHYPEGYLTRKKDRIVANSRLSRATVARGLDRFIRSTQFSSHSWRPLYVDEVQNKEETRELSTKTLADVIESLIGASYLDGGMDKAITCCRLFIPEVNWHNIYACQRGIYAQRPSMNSLLSTLEPLEPLLGYRFRNKRLLIDAVTHQSCVTDSSDDQCLERLEFIGDAILDSLIISAIWNLDQNSDFSQGTMHGLRTASVNADFLGFLVMEWSADDKTAHPSPEPVTTPLAQSQIPSSRALWTFLRHANRTLAIELQSAAARHSARREEILSSLQSAPIYPWIELAQLALPKIISDMLESVLGAVWVDSGSLEVCTTVAERVGILSCLRHFVHDQVEMRHPKCRLGEAVGSQKVRYDVSHQIAGKKRGHSPEGREYGGGDGLEAEYAMERAVGKGSFSCGVYVDEELMAEVEGCIKRDVAEGLAAERAIDVFMERKEMERQVVVDILEEGELVEEG